MRTDKILSMLGLAKKAGKLAGGEFSVEKAVKSGRAAVVIVAADASQNTHKLFINMCTFYQVPCYLYSSKEELGHALGRDIQASVAALDDGFADAIEKRLLQAGVEQSVAEYEEFEDDDTDEFDRM